ncbi:phosphopentomutase [Thermoanaerobacterium sp. DL9XJH110]|uniref:phosphopentomutase n=1 Tax=Thermoanaerobacterium sp. DL9XJH110 TaxID=3386643 RepID=UPI003BB7D439
MKRAILLVIDSLGVGEMDDVYKVRPQDRGANTLKHVAEAVKNFRLPNLEALGAGYLVDSDNIKKVENPLASYGKSILAHFGADTYQGHQEIMGSRPKMPVVKPFIHYIDRVEKALKEKGYEVKRPYPAHPLLLVNGLVTVADNLEADPGQNYNVTAPLDYISFEDELAVGRLVRENVEVGRVIVLGGRGITVEDILHAVEVKDGDIIGVDCPKCGVYKRGYMVRHLGYGVNPDAQVPTLLKKAGFAVSLIGKMADVIECEGADYHPRVETDGVMELVLEKMKSQPGGLIAANVQETDLAGHSRDPEKYAEKLMSVDEYLRRVLDEMKEEDMLIITGDHGNDPTIGHSHHTREKALLLVYGKNFRSVDLGERKTLSDIGATIAEFFGINSPENGDSFLKNIC